MTTSLDAHENQVIGARVRGFLAGMASGLAKVVVGHPFDTIKVRMQTEGYGGRFASPLDCVRTTLRTEGFRGVYKGATPPLVGWMLIDTVMVGTYTNTRAAFQRWHRQRTGDAERPMPFRYAFASGVVAGAVSSFIVCPVEQVKARLQVQYADPSTQLYRGPIDCVRKLVRHNGVRGLYNGLSATMLFRMNIAIYFGTYETYTSLFAESTLARPMVNFICGGAAATTLWLVAFPLDVVKNRMMAQPDTADRPYRTLRECVTKMWRHEGWRSFYRGFTPCLLRSVPANGTAFLALETVLRLLP